MKRGLTLMETVVSTFIVALVLIALFNLFPTSMYALKQAENQIVADQLAQTWLEMYRAESMDYLNTNVGGPYTLAAKKFGGMTFQSELRIGTPSGTDADLVKSLNVRVTWTFQKRAREVVREAWVSRVRP